MKSQIKNNLSFFFLVIGCLFLFSCTQKNTISVSNTGNGIVEEQLFTIARDSFPAISEKQMILLKTGKGPAVFLSSPALRYMNGSIVTVDGGWMGG